MGLPEMKLRWTDLSTGRTGGILDHVKTSSSGATAWSLWKSLYFRWRRICTTLFFFYGTHEVPTFIMEPAESPGDCGVASGLCFHIIHHLYRRSLFNLSAAPTPVGSPRTSVPLDSRNQGFGRVVTTRSSLLVPRCT